MIVTVIEPTPLPREAKPFPKLMNYEELVVLFTGRGVGTVVKPYLDNRIGLHRTDWLMDKFTDYTKAIVLENT